ncbi:MAG: ABC transporter permease [Oscillospiraceae bacterium]
MLRYTIHRLLLLIPVLVGVVVLVFTINYFSSVSPVYSLINVNSTQEDIDRITHELGLDRPYFVQLGDYFYRLIFHGDFGTSYIHKVSVWSLVHDRFPVTVRIGLSAAILSTMMGIPLGILAAVKQNTVLDYSSTFLAVIMAALPSFWVCLILMLFFAVQLRWVPVSGIDTWKGYILPIVSSALMPVAMTMRMTRSSILEVIRQDYIRTARAKGLPEKKVIWKHTLQNALIPVMTVVGMNIGMSLTGSVISETIFNIPGMGSLMSSSITQKDFITTQSCVLICAFIISGMNMITDLAYALVDPRIKAEYSHLAAKKGKSKSKAGETAAEEGAA